MNNKIKEELKVFIRNSLNEFFDNGNVYEFNEADFPVISQLKKGIGIVVRFEDNIIGETFHVTTDRTFLLNFRDMLLYIMKKSSKRQLHDIYHELSFDIFLTHNLRAVKKFDELDLSEYGIFIQQLEKTACRFPEKSGKTNQEILRELIEKTGGKSDNSSDSGFLVFSFDADKITV